MSHVTQSIFMELHVITIIAKTMSTSLKPSIGYDGTDHDITPQSQLKLY